ncbi:MAG: hypothetical protein KKC84_04750, partial [Candidatus Omnitrophica bacterium]|nr:hypothetical protein [Candidatus Omnitrophota bacterium]
MRKEADPEPRNKYTEPQPPRFHSHFKPWVRTVALAVAVMFIPEQFAHAIGFDAQVLWKVPEVYVPIIPQESPKGNLPGRIKNLLSDLSVQQKTSITLSPSVTLKLQKPLSLSKERIAEIMRWLQGRPCGTKALIDLLRYYQIPFAEEEVAALALAVDIFHGITILQGDPSQIKTSLYALGQAADFFGLKLSPVKIGLSPNILQKCPIPFIAHLKNDHYILVTEAKEETVTFLDEHLKTQMSMEKFLAEFSGYTLVRTHHTKDSFAEFLTDDHARSIMGARTNRIQHAHVGGIFKQRSWKEAAIGIGISAATSLIGGASSLKAVATAYATSQFASTVAQTGTNIGVQMGMSRGTAQVLGYAVQGAVGGLNPDAGFKDNLKNMGRGAARGTTMGTAKLGTYKMVKSTGLYKYNSMLANQVTSLAAVGMGSLAYGALSSSASARFGGSSEGGFVQGLKDTFGSEGFKSYMVSTGVNIGTQLGAQALGLGRFGEYSAVIGHTLGQAAGDRFVAQTGSDMSVQQGSKWGQFAKATRRGLTTAAIDMGLSKASKRFTKNLQTRAAIEFAGATLAAAGWGALTQSKSPDGSVGLHGETTDKSRAQVFKDQFRSRAREYSARLADNLQVQGDTQGWNAMARIEKTAQFTGVADYKFKADQMMSASGQSWKQLVKSGQAVSLLPTASTSIVGITTQSMHASATQSVQDIGQDVYMRNIGQVIKTREDLGAGFSKEEKIRIKRRGDSFMSDELNPFRRVTIDRTIRGKVGTQEEFVSQLLTIDDANQGVRDMSIDATILQRPGANIEFTDSQTMKIHVENARADIGVQAMADGSYRTQMRDFDVRDTASEYESMFGDGSGTSGGSGSGVGGAAGKPVSGEGVHLAATTLGTSGNTFLGGQNVWVHQPGGGVDTRSAAFGEGATWGVSQYQIVGKDQKTSDDYGAVRESGVALRHDITVGNIAGHTGTLVFGKRGSIGAGSDIAAVRGYAVNGPIEIAPTSGDSRMPSHGGTLDRLDVLTIHSGGQSSVDWDLSRAHGTMTQEFQGAAPSTSEITDLYATTFDDGSKQAT